MIALKGLRKSYGKHEVLKGVDFSVKEGEVVVLLGASGSGKTTLLRCINFLERANEGTLRIGDKTVNLAKLHKKDIQELRKKTAMVFQTFDLFNNKNVIENVTEGLIVGRKMPKEEAVKIAEETLEKVGLTSKLNSKSYALSGGEQQRVGIARALALNPSVILFDEPTSALDPEKVNEILDIIKRVAKSGITMIVVTHEMDFAYDVADKVAVLHEGEIIEQGNPKDVFTHPQHEHTRQFLGKFALSKRPEYFL